jgi:hypothetical protein
VAFFGRFPAAAVEFPDSVTPTACRVACRGDPHGAMLFQAFFTALPLPSFPHVTGTFLSRAAKSLKAFSVSAIAADLFTLL